MTDPRPAAAYNNNSSSQGGAPASAGTNRYHPAMQFSSIVPSSSSQSSTTSSSNRNSPLLSSTTKKTEPSSQQRWKAFPATTAGVVPSVASSQQQQHASLSSSSWKNPTTTTANSARQWPTTTSRNNNINKHSNHDDPPDPELVTLPSEEDSLLSMPSTEITSNGHYANRGSNNKMPTTSALHKWRVATATTTSKTTTPQPAVVVPHWKKKRSPQPPQFLMEQQQPHEEVESSPSPATDSPANSQPSPSSTVVCSPSHNNKLYRGTGGAATYLAPSASWIKPSKDEDDDEEEEVEGTKNSSMTGSRSTAAAIAPRPRLASPPPPPQQPKQQQLPLWKQQLLKQRQDRSLVASSPTQWSSPPATTVPVQKFERSPASMPAASSGSNNQTSPAMEATAASTSLEPEPESATTPRPSLVSERLAQFSGGGGTNSTNKKSSAGPKPVSSSSGPKKTTYHQQQQSKFNPLPKAKEPTRQITPPPPQMDDNEPRAPVGTTTPPRTSRYVPPPTHHSFVPLSSASARKTPGRSPPPPQVHPPQHSNSSNGSHIRRPTTHLEIVPAPPPGNMNKTSNWVSPRTKRLQACDDAIGDLKVVPTESEDEIRSTPHVQDHGCGVVENKISVKDMKAKLWDGTKLKATVSAPTVAEVRTPPRRTTTNTSSPPPSRIAKGLIDVATPQGLAPPVRTTPHSKSSDSSHREKVPSQPDGAVAMSLLLPLQEEQQLDNYGPVVMSENGGVEMLLKDQVLSEQTTVESEGTGSRLPARSGRSFKANVANVLLAPAGANSSHQQQPPWVLRRRDVVSEEKKSSESASTELSLNEGFDLSPAEDDLSVEVPEQQVAVDNHHSRSTSLGDFRIDEANGLAADHGNGVEEPVPSTPPPPTKIMELPLSGRPSSDEPDFPPLQLSMSPSSSSQKQISTQKPPLSPTPPLRQRNTFAETIDCPPSDDLGDEEKDDAVAADADVIADKIYAERLPMTPARAEVTQPWVKDVNTLSPASWQRKKLEDGNNSSSSRENRSPVKSNAAALSKSKTTYSTPVRLQQQPSPGSTLLQMAADSIHALDFEQVMLPQPVLSEDGSDSLFSDNNTGDAVPMTTTSSVPAQVPPEFRQTIADHGEASSQSSLSPPRKLRVADRARALAQWNGGLGAPLRPDDDDDDHDDNDELSPIRPQSSDVGGADVMSPRLNHRGKALDDWQQIKSYNSSSFEQNSEFDHVPQFGDSLADDKDWSIDENDPSVDLDPFGVAPISPTDTTSDEVATVSSSVKPIGKPRRDSEPRKQKNRRARLVRMEALHQQQVVVPQEKEEEERSMVPEDPFALDERIANNHELVEEEENDRSTTFDFDPFAVDGTFGEKVEFTETTEFTEGSDFFGTAAPIISGTATSQDFFSMRNFTEPWTESTATTNRITITTNVDDAALNRVDADFWSYEADISTLHEEDSTRHIEI